MGGGGGCEVSVGEKGRTVTLNVTPTATLFPSTATKGKSGRDQSL